MESLVCEKKKGDRRLWLSLSALIVGITATTAACISAMVIIPKLNELQAAQDDADDAGVVAPASDSGTTTGSNVGVVSDEARRRGRPTSSPTTGAPTPCGWGQTTEVPVVCEDIEIFNTTTRYHDCECEPETFGVLNVGYQHSVGGYYGWQYKSDYPNFYPLRDVHSYVGDTIMFKSKGYTDDDLWLVTQDVYESCDFSNTTDLQQLASWNQIRDDTDSDPYYPGGFSFLVQDWLVRERGNPVYFASSRYWDDRTETASCELGVKVRVWIDNRTAVPVMTNTTELDLTTERTVQQLSAQIGALSRTMILTQFSAEQRVRSEGQSGLSNTRGHYDGDEAYDDGTYTSSAVASIHDHSDNIIVVGMGEIQAVLNGVEFKTRHNDYNLNMPSTNSSEYGATEPIQYPNVPPAVLALRKAESQIEEMQEWFRAFATQNKSHRNYPTFFKPILCYLEGTWILDDDSLDEPFDSDRHFIDAASWKELHDKIRYMSNSGRKNADENLAHLPSCIRNLVNDTFPIVSNWEYRIVCAPLQNDVPTSRLRVVDDLGVQLMGSPMTRGELLTSRRARFELNTYINPDDPDEDPVEWQAGLKQWNYLDYLMEQIPGKDNYMADITDELPDGTKRANQYNSNQAMNAGYYSRYYGVNDGDSMGSSKHRRSWNDRYLFAAKTTQSKVSPVSIEYVYENETTGETMSVESVSRWSYAIPIELIYQTPLSKWNPYDIEFKESDDYDSDRTGSCDTKSDAFNGWTTNNAYFTPAAFFEGITSSDSDGDTASTDACALDSSGDSFAVYPSGHWITFPEIGNDVGVIRQRYPIFPIHEGGSAAFKEIKALEELVLNDDYDDPVANPDGFFGDSRDVVYGFEVSLQGGGHRHFCYIPGWKVVRKWANDDGTWCNEAACYLEIECDERNSHTHTVRIWRELDTDGVSWKYRLSDCRFGSLSDEGEMVYPDAWNTADANGDAACADRHDSIIR